MTDMSGYGNRIYREKKNKSPLILVLVALAVGLGSYLVFTSLPQRSAAPEADVSTPEVIPSVPEQVPKNETPEQSRKPTERLMTEPVPEVAEKNTESSPPETASAGSEAPGYNPLNLYQLSEQARRNFQNKKYREALECYQQISEHDRKAVTSVGICYYFLNEYQKACYTLENAVGNDQKDFEAHKFLAYSYYQIDDLDESWDEVETALKLRKDAELLAFQARLKRELDVMEDGYRDTQSLNFKIVFSRYEHDDIRRTVFDYLKEAYREVGKEMNFNPSQPITVILYNEKSFFDVTRSPGWAGGLYDGKIRLPIKDIEGKESEVKRIITHEYVHALIHDITSFCPLWLNEGLAEYFSLVEDRETIGQIIPLDKLERGFPSDPRAVMISYRESFSAVSHLVDKFGMYRVVELLEKLNQEKDVRKAFDEVFYYSYDRFLETWGRD